MHASAVAKLQRPQARATFTFSLVISRHCSHALLVDHPCADRRLFAAAAIVSLALTACAPEGPLSEARHHGAAFGRNFELTVARKAARPGRFSRQAVGVFFASRNPGFCPTGWPRSPGGAQLALTRAVQACSSHRPRSLYPRAAAALRGRLHPLRRAPWRCGRDRGVARKSGHLRKAPGSRRQLQGPSAHIFVFDPHCRLRLYVRPAWAPTRSPTPSRAHSTSGERRAG